MSDLDLVVVQCTVTSSSIIYFPSYESFASTFHLYFSILCYPLDLLELPSVCNWPYFAENELVIDYAQLKLLRNFHVPPVFKPQFQTQTTNSFTSAKQQPLNSQVPLPAERITMSPCSTNTNYQVIFNIHCHKCGRTNQIKLSLSADLEPCPKICYSCSHILCCSETPKDLYAENKIRPYVEVADKSPR